MTTLYIGNHTSSSKGYTAMAKQMIANGGNTFAFLPEIHAEERQKPSTKKTYISFSNLQNPITSEKLLHMRHTH